jgi:hypothetical protein
LIEDNSIWKDVIIYDPNNGDMPVNNNEDIIAIGIDDGRPWIEH